MASTSLRRQVEALRHASSGTSSGYLQRKKGRPSLLLTPDQAAEVDLSSVREAALVGLQRLEAVDQNFSAFEMTLFSKDAESTLRDLLTKEANERINKSIDSFLALLSPHFSSREAHVCLEYLIRHYKIYQHNVDAVVECCLPWHDTVAFARMVQLLSLKGSRWEFLTPVQKTGSPLPREVIARKCARDFGLLRFLCVSARRSAAAASERSSGRGAAPVSSATASGRAKLFSFYAAVIVEALASLSSASEPLLRALVPNIIPGLAATKAPEYQMASYMILSALSGKGPLSPEVTSAALTSLVSKPCQGGLEPPLLCAFAVVQSQVGFTKKSSFGAPPLMLPEAAFRKLSGMESLPVILADLARKFDATAFLWLLLQSYVQHLPDSDGEHGVSLTRLCAYPHWPTHSLPRLIRSLVDKLIKVFLTVEHEGLAHETGNGGKQEKKQRAVRMRSETERVLRVLGQRLPQEVDPAIAKRSRYISKSKAAAAAAVAAAVKDGDKTEVDDLAEAVDRADFEEKAFSSLLVAAFSGVGLASRLPLLRDSEVEASANENIASPLSVIHGSLMVALEHSSGAVRSRGLDQLACVVSKAGVGVDVVGDGDGEVLDNDLSGMVLKRLYDEDPQVVLAVTDSDALVESVLLRPVGDDSSLEEKSCRSAISSQAAVVASTAASASARWLSTLSEARPLHPFASVGRVLSGLLRLAAKAVVVECANNDGIKITVDVTSQLILECLPGPHMMARARAARRAANADASSLEGTTVESIARARKKALRTVGHAASKAVGIVDAALGGVGAFSVFAGAGKTLEMAVCAWPEDGKKSSKPIRDVMEDAVAEEEPVLKLKGLKAMEESVCDTLAGMFAKGVDVDRLKNLAHTCGPGARWLLLGVTSRAMALLSSGNVPPSDTSEAAVTALASLLASLSMLEISRQQRGGGSTEAGAASASHLLGYLRMTAPYLPRPARPFSLVACDHVTSQPSQSIKGDDISDEDVDSTAQQGCVSSPSSGDVLAPALDISASHGDTDKAASRAIGAILLRGFGGRPLLPLAAIAIAGVCASDVDGQGLGVSSRVLVGDRVARAAQAFCVAATFLTAAVESAAVKDKVECEIAAMDEGAIKTAGDLVVVFPAAVLAVASGDERMRDAGLLFISAVAYRGNALCTRLKKVEPAHAANDAELHGLKDSFIFPLSDDGDGDGGERREPSPLCAPPLRSIVDLAGLLSARNRESTLDGTELARYLEAVLGSSSIMDKGIASDLARYLVAWGARLGWRDPSASALLLYCLSSAKHPLRECGMPLLRHYLESENLPDKPSIRRLMKLLISVTLVTSPSYDDPSVPKSQKSPSSKGKDLKKKGDNTRGNGRLETFSAPLFFSSEAEDLFQKACFTAGHVQTSALEALMESSPTIGVNESGERVLQGRRLLRAVIDAGLAGADLNMVSGAAQALSVRPCDLAALVLDVAPGKGIDTCNSLEDKKKGKRWTTAMPVKGWVSTLGGIVELAQALCSSAGDSAVKSDCSMKWRDAAPSILARPLFDILPDVLAIVSGSPSSSNDGDVKDADVPDDGTIASAEYALWLTMDLIGTVLKRRRWFGSKGHKNDKLQYYDGDFAGEDAGKVLRCFKENPSPQTRNSALGLLSTMAAMFPGAIASRLHDFLDAVSTAASISDDGGGKMMLRQTQKAVQSIVPALKEHGAEAGVGAHFVGQVFVDALSHAHVLTRRSLFTTLIDSLGGNSLPIVSALLLLQAFLSGGDDDVRTMRMEFVQQIVHFRRPHEQVSTLVGLVQACHRLSVYAAELSGNLTGQKLEDTTASFCSSATLARGEADYLKLPLQASQEAKGEGAGAQVPKGSSRFMMMDLRAMSLSATTSGKEAQALGMFVDHLFSFVKNFLTSKPLVMAVAAVAEQEGDDREDLQEGFLMLCEELLLLLKTLTACEHGGVTSSDPGNGNGGRSGSEPSWAVLKGRAHSILEALHTLLSVPSFVAVTQELIRHEDPHLRRKALQMLTRRLDPAGKVAPRLSPAEEILFVEMLPSLRSVVTGVKFSPLSSSSTGDGSVGEDDSVQGLEEVMGRQPMDDEISNEERETTETSVNRQTALLTLDVLARVLGTRHQTEFTDLLADVTGVVAGGGPGALAGIDESSAEGSLAVRSSAFLLLATLCAVLGVRAFLLLPRFFPAMLEALEAHSRPQAQPHSPFPHRAYRDGSQGLLWTSALSAVATVAASLPSFLSPYLDRILAIAFRPAATSATAVDRVLSLLAAGVESRLLIPAMCGAYAGCIGVSSDNHGGSADASGRARSVARLLTYTQEVVAGLDKQDASAALPQLTHLLTQALDFRRLHASESTSQARASAELVESEVSSALVCLVMRLSEVELRPLFFHLCEWKAAVSGDGDGVEAKLGELDRRLSFYRVLGEFAASLKSIFTPYFAHVLPDCCDDMAAASDLATTSASSSSSDGNRGGKRKRDRKGESQQKRRKKDGSAPTTSIEGDGEEACDTEDVDKHATPELRWRRSLCSRRILSALRRCFQFDRSGFVDKARFELVLPEVVSQLECGGDFTSSDANSSAVDSDVVSSRSSEGAAQDEVVSCRLHAEEVVGPCLAQLALACPKDLLWKTLVNAVLMRTRSPRAGVRVAALVSLRQCFEVIGEEFLSLLPECLPFLSEMLEDGHLEVETECRSLIKYIEGILGESIESYLV